MPSLLCPRVWTSQPQVPVGIDWSNPLTTGLVDAFIPQEPKSKKGLVKTTSGTVGYSSSQGAVGVSFSDASAAYVSYSSPNLRPSTNAPYTLIVRYKLTAVPVASVRVASSFLSVNYGYTIAPNNVNFRTIVTSGGTNITLTGGAVSTKQKIDALVFSGTNCSLYENGILTAGPSAASSVASSRDFYIGSDGNGSNAAPSVVSFVAFYNRALSAAEIKSLSDNPWQIFSPQVT